MMNTHADQGEQPLVFDLLHPQVQVRHVERAPIKPYSSPMPLSSRVVAIRLRAA